MQNLTLLAFTSFILKENYYLVLNICSHTDFPEFLLVWKEDVCEQIICIN